MPYERKVVTTEDKSSTVYIPELGECYHSSHGAVRESDHIFIENGLKYVYDRSDKEINILEFGFGTGLNAYLSLIFSVRNGIPVFYHTIEKFPLSEKEWKALNYPALIDCEDVDNFSKLHETPWDSRQTICHRFSIFKQKEDFRRINPEYGKYDCIYFDAFSPNAQPELWTEEVFSLCNKALKHNGILVSYCVKGKVKAILRNSGFKVYRLPGPPGKREMLRAQKIA